MNDSSPARPRKKEPDFFKTRIGIAVVFALASVVTSVYGGVPILAVAFIMASLGCVGCNTTVKALRDVALRLVDKKPGIPQATKKTTIPKKLAAKVNIENGKKMQPSTRRIKKTKIKTSKKKRH